MSDDAGEDGEDRLKELAAQITELSERCHFRTLLRLAQEARRLARVEQRVIPYVNAGFHVMNDSRNVLRPADGREMAIELIALLESDERARQFQPELPEDEYERTKWWLTACSYDNLAVSTAELHGYNSEGMHQCIADGIQVCRRTGKLQCISCFREYATNVYLAADDLDLALHHARVGIHNIDPGPHDRRHVGAKDSARILTLQGQLDAALEVLDQAWQLADVYHSPYAGKIDTYWRVFELSHLAGCPERMSSLPRILSAEEAGGVSRSDQEVLAEPPRDEFPSHFLDRDMAQAFVDCCGGAWDAALGRLQPWDVQLRGQDSLTRWFEVRLRIVALLKLWGKDSRAEALAQPLREAAQQARDWLTLRRLNRVFDDFHSTTPLALVGPVYRGPFAERTVAAIPDSPEALTAEVPHESSGAAEDLTEASPRILELRERLDAALDDSSRIVASLADALTWNPRTLEAREASGLLHVMRFFAVESAQLPGVWPWTRAVIDAHPQDATVQSLAACLGAVLRTAPGFETDLIPTEVLESLFRQSLDLDPQSGANHARAGAFYLELENLGEAERCLARAFRFLRTSGAVARQLAEVYRKTDRPRDAIAVLDMALREGCTEADVAREAALASLQQDQHEVALTYLDRYESLAPGQPWTHYYRASALVELKRPSEALTALDEESRRNEDQEFPRTVLRGCALAALGQEAEFRGNLDEILAARLFDMNYLTLHGLQRMFGQLWEATVALLPITDPDRVRLESRLLESGLAPNELFSEHRRNGTEAAVSFYQCTIEQRLDERWSEFPARLAWEEDWSSYVNVWGVLAADEKKARELVLQWQRRCYPLNSEIREITEEDSGYTDIPGVVWQGYRENPQPEE